MKYLALCLILALMSKASAETLYTTLQDTPIQDKATAEGATVIAHLSTGSMIETVKEVGAFTTVSFIQDGKVKTGFATTAQIRNDANHDAGAVSSTDAPAPTDAAPEVTSSLPVASTQPVASSSPVLSTSPAESAPSRETENLRDPLASRLDRIQISANELASFAKRGKLIARKPKAKATP